MNRLNTIKIGWILGCWLAMLVGPAFAQQTKIEAKMDSVSILLGHQTNIRLGWVQDKEKRVIPLIPKDTLVKGVEVLNVSLPDTTALDDTRLQIDQDVLITSFDSGFYYIPPFRCMDGSDTLISNSLSLKVVTLPVDTTGAEFFDIKTVMKPPLVWTDYLYILWILLGIAVVAVLIYLYIRYRNHKPILPVEKKEPDLPPHVRAIQALEQLKTEKLWQNNREKEYYTRLTDVLRYYIYERFGINAMEMTSAEILSLIRAYSDANSVYENLKQVLQVADFVKFAKLKPLPDENEVSMMNALFFVSQTKEPEKTEESESSDVGNAAGESNEKTND